MSEKRKIVHAVLFPLLFTAAMWLNFAIFNVLDWDMGLIGIAPLSLYGIIGVFGSPLAHGSVDHITSNSVSFIVLSTFLFYFYRLIAYRVFFLNWIISGILLWIGGRDSVHIGASGIVYGLAFFIFFSGMLRREKSLMALSFIVIFLYGGMLWGMLPQNGNISWEGHLFGAVSGFILAWYYRKNPIDFIAVEDGSSVSVTWGQENNLVYEYLGDDEDIDFFPEDKD